jgi:hypothetical protein
MKPSPSEGDGRIKMLLTRSSKVYHMSTVIPTYHYALNKPAPAWVRVKEKIVGTRKSE